MQQKRVTTCIADNLQEWTLSLRTAQASADLPLLRGEIAPMI